MLITSSDNGILVSLSQYLGTTEPAVRLIISLIAGYPLGLIHRKFIYGKTPIIQHLYCILTGFGLGYWNYGSDILNAIYAIFFTYLILVIFGGTLLSVSIIFLTNLIYLLVGYYYTSTNNYDINWTVPQCVLVLRLIASVFDLYDGQRPIEQLSNDNKKVALKQCPNIFEYFAHMLFPPSFLVGPHFNLKRYQDYVDGKFGERDLEPPNSINAALTRASLGLLYLIIFQISSLFVNDDYIMTEEFAQLGFLRKLLLIGIWGRYTLYKYISCWLLAEGACILFGVTYNGKNDDDGTIRWDGCQNVKISIFENTTEFNHYILSFNINTNHWVAQYVYKRLKFLNNRHISQLAALTFLAIWHGLHSGYYVCFFFEFIVIYMERDIKSIVNNNQGLSKFFEDSRVKLVRHFLLRIYTFVFMGWCLVPFALLKFDRYWQCFGSLNYIGIIFFVFYPLIYSPLLRILIKRDKNNKEKL